MQNILSKGEPQTGLASVLLQEPLQTVVKSHPHDEFMFLFATVP